MRNIYKAWESLPEDAVGAKSLQRLVRFGSGYKLDHQGLWLSPMSGDRG